MADAGAESTIGDRVREIRIRKGLTQAQVADRAGLNRMTIGRTESGETVPSSAVIVKIAGALGVDSGELFSPVSPLADEPLLDRPEVRGWLQERGHKRDEAFLEEVVELSSLEEIEDYLDEMMAFRDSLLEETRNTEVRRRLFPIGPDLSPTESERALLGRASLANRLRWEIRHEFLIRENTLAHYSRHLYLQGRTEDYLARVRDPRRHARMVQARKRILDEAFTTAKAAAVG